MEARFGAGRDSAVAAARLTVNRRDARLNIGVGRPPVGLLFACPTVGGLFAEIRLRV